MASVRSVFSFQCLFESSPLLILRFFWMCWMSGLFCDLESMFSCRNWANWCGRRGL